MRILAAVLFACATTLASWSQAQDLPIRVGRIAHIEGQASVFQDPEAGWERAYINSPITSENSVWTGEGSRAEVRVSGLAIRLDHRTQLDVARLDEDELDAYVAQGTVAVRVRHHENTERLVFNTPNARVRLRENGRYRIDVDPERYETRITVFSGEAGVGAEDGRVRVAAGHSVVVFGADPPEFVEERIVTGAFDRWVLARDERWREGRAPTYVSTYMTGYEDLDAYGQWVTEPEYGVLWYPRQVAAGWAPYRYGRWDYVRPWGWTWVDDAPWGYAPFHYGRWVYVRDRWGWMPGERIARPVWAPALVAWVGGSNWNVSVSTGGPALGWYPLSPWDRYDPWFNASPTYVQRVNVIVRSEPTRPDRRQWRQWTRERGMTVVDRRVLVEQQPVQRAVQRVSTDVIRRVQPAPRPEAVLPTRNDVIERRRERPRQAVAAPRVIAQAPAQAGAPSRTSEVARPNFGRNAVVATPRRASEQERQAQRQQAQRPAQERAQRERQQGQQRAQRDQQQAQERQAREQQQAQQRQAREQQQAQQRQAREQQQAQRQAQEREQQQAQERQAREQQQAQQRQAREQQQAQQRQAREQQQAQRQAQERAQREQQQAQERQAREQQQAQRQAQERAQREQQQAQARQAREQQQAQRQAQERAQREQQQAQERQARDQQQAQERAQRGQQQAQARLAREQQQAQRQAQQQAQAQAHAEAQAQARQQGRGRGPQRDEDEEKEKGKGKGRD